MAKRRVKLTGRGRKPAAGKSPKRSRPTPHRKRGGLRSQTLPGMEQVRDQKLDNICESIVDEREVMNTAKLEEVQLLKRALTRMHDRNILIYIHGELELARVPGAEKIRARMIKRKGKADEDVTEIGGDEIEAAGGEPADLTDESGAPDPGEIVG